VLAKPDYTAVLDELWLQLGCEVVLPEPLEAFLSPKGPLPAEFVDQRRYRRFHYRLKAILTRNGRHAAVYTKNIARGGLCFLHCEQLFPLEEVSLFLPTGDKVRLIVRRCRRQRENCFECGADIHEITHGLDQHLLEMANG
jgi:hypothetical protein